MHATSETIENCHGCLWWPCQRVKNKCADFMDGKQRTCCKRDLSAKWVSTACTWSASCHAGNDTIFWQHVSTSNLAPHKRWTSSETKRTLHHVRPLFSGLFLWKTLENACNVENYWKLAWMLVVAMPACEKQLSVFHGWETENVL